MADLLSPLLLKAYTAAHVSIRGRAHACNVAGLTFKTGVILRKINKCLPQSTEGRTLCLKSLVCYQNTAGSR